MMIVASLLPSFKMYADPIDVPIILGYIDPANGNVKIQSNGRIIPCTNKNFSIPLGAKMNISSGRIK